MFLCQIFDADGKKVPNSYTYSLHSHTKMRKIINKTEIDENEVDYQQFCKFHDSRTDP